MEDEGKKNNIIHYYLFLMGLVKIVFIVLYYLSFISIRDNVLLLFLFNSYMSNGFTNHSVFLLVVMLLPSRIVLCNHFN